ncbi:heme o synthase [Dasania sp. GY-MA-18]|uniref:Protoheme IX farnesyltransferase n=1 Tax=Dasania phycosphaerae TaxID=2950436 RepID=A0A9J6RI03_9GAMM|nr:MULTISPECIES: heme o synthase [Dasania]MCR8921468.1 heme o synthase [Dasania sp. GY-MA-18]MCZ0863896.1 heme o synthase [Dasania phycosphaerae]MCZ0867624.1 heme o synthase [Dasania phycosphaerae]
MKLQASSKHLINATLIAQYVELCKPKVVLLLLLTAVVGMHLASPGLLNPIIFIAATTGIGLAACSAAIVNHVVDQNIDALMRRTQRRPMPSGAINNRQALLFSLVLAVLSMAILLYWVNALTALLTLAGLIGYAFIYTLYLKHATPQNIVIGGLSGALPPLLGWVSVSNSIDREALLLVLIIFVWTPAHFWALAIDRVEDYKRANIPMLPVTHGIEFTKSNVVFYTLALVLVSLIPYFIAMSGLLYVLAALGLGSWFLYYALELKFFAKPGSALKTFYVSIAYLFYLFIALLVDHYLPLNWQW